MSMLLKGVLDTKYKTDSSSHIFLDELCLFPAGSSTVVTLREISLTQQLQGSLHGFFRSRLPFSTVQVALTLLGVPTVEHLSEVCDHTATCLMAT